MTFNLLLNSSRFNLLIIYSVMIRCWYCDNTSQQQVVQFSSQRKKAQLVYEGYTFDTETVLFWNEIKTVIWDQLIAALIDNKNKTGWDNLDKNLMWERKIGFSWTKGPVYTFEIMWLEYCAIKWKTSSNCIFCLFGCHWQLSCMKMTTGMLFVFNFWWVFYQCQYAEYYCKMLV